MKVFAASIACALLSAFSAVASASEHSVLSTLPDARFPQETRIVSGAIDGADVARLSDAGVGHVIDLRTKDEHPDFDEEKAVLEQGMAYHNIPVKGGESLTRQNAQRLDDVLQQIGDEPALIHCSSGNRVGALIAVREAWINGQPTEAAIAEGKRWGLAMLEDRVRAILAAEASRTQ